MSQICSYFPENIEYPIYSHIFFILSTGKNVTTVEARDILF